MDRIRLGVIGVGRQAEAHLAALTRFPDVELRAFCDQRPERLVDQAERYGIAARYVHLEEMLAQEALDAVVIAVDVRSIHPVAQTCLQWGLDALIQAPPGTRLAETRELAWLAQRNECETLVGFNRRFMPVVREARALVERQGPIVTALAEFHQRPEEALHPLLVASLSHSVDFLCWLGGDVKAVQGRVRPSDTGRPDACNAMIEFENGLIGHLLGHHHAAARVERGEMHGPRASAYLEGIGDRAHVILDGVEFEIRGRPPGADGTEHQARFFIDCLKEGRSVGYPASTLTEAVKTMAVIETLYGE